MPHVALPEVSQADAGSLETVSCCEAEPRRFLAKFGRHSSNQRN
jgi:hypothetical protein